MIRPTQLASKPTIAWLIFLIFFPGCHTIPADVAAPKISDSVSGLKSGPERGREVYVSFMKCAMCHRPKPVYDYDPVTWEKEILPRMAKRARLKPNDYTAVLSYVTSPEVQRRLDSLAGTTRTEGQ